MLAKTRMIIMTIATEILMATKMPIASTKTRSKLSRRIMTVAKLNQLKPVKIMSRMTNLQYSKFVKDIDANTNENMSTSSIKAV